VHPDVTRSALVLLFVLTAVGLAGAHGGEPEVRVQGRLVSATFEATPATEAFEAVRRATGVAVSLPPVISGKTLTLRLVSVPLELVLQRMVEALDFGGFALEYAPGGLADRLIVIQKGRGDDRPHPVALPVTGRPSAGILHSGQTELPTVPLLIRRSEAESMTLGRRDLRIVVESAPFITVETSECGGTRGRYPVQSVRVIDGVRTHLTTVVVCHGAGLRAGRALTITALTTDTVSDGLYSRFVGADPSRHESDHD
jgi:hypothetical protein